MAKVDIGFTSALAVHNNVTIAASLIENRSLRNPCLEKLMSGARVTYYMDGTTDILNMVIGRSLG